ncbi:MAG: metal ABC transporter substrate-binding protein [Acutalibacteraceae bacterium]
MKRITALFISVLLLILLCGCGSSTKDNGGKLKIICTIFSQYDFIRNIAGDHVDLKMLVPFGMESHDFSLENMTVADVANVGASDLVIYTGGESDSDWINTLRCSVKGSTEWLALTDIVEPLPELLSQSMNISHVHSDGHHEHEENETDEHVWTSPKRAVEIVEALKDKLSALDPYNAGIYSDNATDYIEKLKLLDQKMTKTVELSEKKTLIFADRFPFRYLCADYGLSYDAAFPGCSSSTDPSVAQIESLTAAASKVGAKAVFYMENSNGIYAKQIAGKVGAKALMLHSCHQVTRDEFKNGASYIGLMDQNIEKIREALS